MARGVGVGVVVRQVAGGTKLMADHSHKADVGGGAPRASRSERRPVPLNSLVEAASWGIGGPYNSFFR